MSELHGQYLYLTTFDNGLLCYVFIDDDEILAMARYAYK